MELVREGVALGRSPGVRQDSEVPRRGRAHVMAS